MHFNQLSPQWKIKQGQDQEAEEQIQIQSPPCYVPGDNSLITCVY